MHSARKIHSILFVSVSVIEWDTLMAEGKIQEMHYGAFCKRFSPLVFRETRKCYLVLGGAQIVTEDTWYLFLFFPTGSHWLVVLLEPPCSFVCLTIYMPQNHGSANILSEAIRLKIKSKMWKKISSMQSRFTHHLASRKRKHLKPQKSGPVCHLWDLRTAIHHQRPWLSRHLIKP